MCHFVEPLEVQHAQSRVNTGKEARDENRELGLEGHRQSFE